MGRGSRTRRDEQRRLRLPAAYEPRGELASPCNLSCCDSHATVGQARAFRCNIITWKKFAVSREDSDLCSCSQTLGTSVFYAREVPALLGPVADDDGCRACGYYRKQVSFAAASLHETITLVIRGQSTEHHLAGFPNNIQWFWTDKMYRPSLVTLIIVSGYGHRPERAFAPPVASVESVLSSRIHQ